ncbi:uncharacterized protein LOC142223803 [Haematobia irritans]|uniref:uncharacterized protein LOC142223803 n=1 Tax=Haematobia irritans TaxID=7368 RepID=UPI003F501436
MSKLLSVLLLVTGCNILGVFAAPPKDVSALPSGISGCKMDATINDCIRKGLVETVKRSKVGIPELNIPPIDPFVREKLSLQFENNIIKGKVSVRNFRVKGLSDVVVGDVDFQRQGKATKLKTHNHIPKLEVDGQYKADVYLNNNKMSSKGDFNAIITDIDALIVSEGELYEKDGHNYVRITKFSIDPTIGNMKLSATGLVPDKNLNDAFVDLANQNWRQSYKDVVQQTQSTWEPLILKHMNNLFEHLPFDLLVKEE